MIRLLPAVDTVSDDILFDLRDDTDTLSPLDAKNVQTLTIAQKPGGNL